MKSGPLPGGLPPGAAAAQSTGRLSVFAGTGRAGPPTAGPATHSDLGYPYGVAVDRSGNVYIADTFNRRVRRCPPPGRLSFVAGTGSPGKPTAGPALSSALGEPAEPAVDGFGNLYVSDFHNDEVVKVTSPEAPVVGITAPGHGGYLMAMARGAIQSFGTPFHGSPAGRHTPLTAPIAGITATPNGGCLLTTTTGSVYAYGT